MSMVVLSRQGWQLLGGVVAFVSPLASSAIDALIAAYFTLSRSGVPGLLVGSDVAVD